ncbi:ATP-binding cassette domain-containing protein [Crenothrix sp.]|uniref:ATP-binding cassette domain-containing protein n=1 Tax=Crenothrix sp. TaxID=3100433 RepID=UPI00374DF11F
MASTHNPLNRLKLLINIEQHDIKTLLAFGVGIGLMSLATPVAVQALVNTISFGALFQPLIVLTLILFVLVGFSNFLVGLQFYVIDMLQRRLFVRLFGEAAFNLQQASYSLRDKQHLPELANRFLDVVTLQKTAAVLLMETLGYFLQTLIGMVLLAFYHPLLLAFDLFLIAAIVFILFVLGKNGINAAIEQSKAKYDALAWLENLAANPMLGKTEQGQAFLKQQTNGIALTYLEASAKHFRILSRQNTGALILHTLANTLLLGMGGWMVIERQLSLGQLIAAELVVNVMIYGLTRLGKTLDNFYEMVASTDKINYLLELPQDSVTGITPQNKASPYQVDVVDLSLPLNTDYDALIDFNLHLVSGEQLAITEGADKSSLFDTLYGLRIPLTGHVCLDQQDLRDLNLRQLRNTIALVREPEILEESVLDNVQLGRDLPVQALKQALENVGLLDDILLLPEGLNTRLSIHGKPLTNEQTLRLTLARAIVGNPRLLLLDNVLDRIDSRVLPSLLAVLFTKQASWTLIVTSHEPKVINLCNRRGKIVKGVFVENPTTIVG